MASVLDPKAIANALRAAQFKVAELEGQLECCAVGVNSGEPITIYIDEDEVTVFPQCGHFHFTMSSEELNLRDTDLATRNFSIRLVDELKSLQNS
jgi:hypothetical protein